jgi:hypothetical protein
VADTEDEGVRDPEELVGKDELDEDDEMELTGADLAADDDEG